MMLITSCLQRIVIRDFNVICSNTGREQDIRTISELSNSIKEVVFRTRITINITPSLHDPELVDVYYKFIKLIFKNNNPIFFGLHTIINILDLAILKDDKDFFIRILILLSRSHANAIQYYYTLSRLVSKKMALDFQEIFHRDKIIFEVRVDMMPTIIYDTIHTAITENNYNSRPYELVDRYVESCGTEYTVKVVNNALIASLIYIFTSFGYEEYFWSQKFSNNHLGMCLSVERQFYNTVIACGEEFEPNRTCEEYSIDYDTRMRIKLDHWIEE